MSIELVTQPHTQKGEEIVDVTLRPSRFDDYIGQETTKENLKILIAAAKKRKESIEHVLLHGGPGLGKTTLANIIAKEMDVHIHVTSGPAIERAGDIAAIISNLQEGDILFIDEIHRLHKVVEEMLYPAMEDYALDVIVGKGPAARTLRLELPKFTLIGATTRMSLIANPLRDRFGAQFQLDFYTPEEIEKIVQRSASLLDIDIESLPAQEIAQRSRRTPRIANRLLKRVRDFSQVKHDGVITHDIATQALDLLAVDRLGLHETDRKILLTMIEKFNGGPVGLQTIAAATGEEQETVEEMYEPFLMQSGLLQRTPRGRMVTPQAYEHLGLTPPHSQSTLTV